MQHLLLSLREYYVLNSGSYPIIRGIVTFFMHGIRIRSYCIYRMHGVEYFGETMFCDLVRFRYAVVVIDATLSSQR